jgi:hypothetical protein
MLARRTLLRPYRIHRSSSLISSHLLNMAKPFNTPAIIQQQLATLAKPSLQECSPVLGFKPTQPLTVPKHAKPTVMVETVEELDQHMERVALDQEVS